MGRRRVRVETVAQGYLEVLASRGVEYLIGNANTSLVDAFARQRARRRPGPAPLLVAHEYPATAMAHGYAMLTGRPQVVMVHSTVGAANAAGAIINAARAQIPILFTAATSPVTDAPGIAGARDIHVHWAQEAFDQRGMLREWVKWDYELRHPGQLEDAVDRALELALAEPRGPVYLTLPRDLMAQPMRAISLETPPRRNSRSRRYPDPARIAEAAEILRRSRRPLIITAEAGRDPGARAALVALAEAGGIAVLEAAPAYANFPAEHPCHAGYVFGSQVYPAVAEADAIVVVDCDAPWFPSRVRPGPRAKVIQVAIDPFFSRYPMRNYPCDVPIAAEPAIALRQLARAVGKPAGRTARLKRLARAHAERRREWRRAAENEAGRVPIGFRWASRCVAETFGTDDIVVNEYPLDLRHADPRPGAYFGPPHSAGLGWGFGAALGAKLAARDRTVVATLGDGSYIFGVPTACHQAACMHGLPVVVVVFNNGAWEEVSKGAAAVHPEGWAMSSGDFPFSALEPSPHFEQIVRAFGGHGERVDAPEALPAALARARRAAQTEKRQALVNVICKR
ncbi:MAG: thiamine pyrophosphate-requiring protein [Burkholderiales bacterium]|nr:thiamine pyrophosphate-requiring protein [Burkholderiales bacterium]